MFKTECIYIPARLGERYALALTICLIITRVIKYYGKINLKDYVSSFIRNVKK